MKTRYLKAHPNYNYWCSLAKENAHCGYFIRGMDSKEAEYHREKLKLFLDYVFSLVIEEAVTDPSRGLRVECLEAVRAKIRGIARVGAGPENLTQREIAVMHSEFVLTCQDLGVPAVAAADVLAEVFYFPE
jgi:hypothetical protein